MWHFLSICFYKLTANCSFFHSYCYFTKHGTPVVSRVPITEIHYEITDRRRRRAYPHRCNFFHRLATIGIREVLQADDGINGIEVARVHRPDIVLCDVRMPRLDGIAMLERLEEILPDIVPVFMSGYSDKEYLKAAIKLKAVNYIEKPLNPAEIRDAIVEARDLCLEKKRTRQNASIHSMENASRLALLLTQPFAHAKGKY